MEKSTKRTKKRSIQYSDPGKILDLVMNLTDETCGNLQIKINTYLRDECEAEMVLQIVVHEERMEAYIETVGNTLLPRKSKITMTQKLQDIMKGCTDNSDYLFNFCSDVQALFGGSVPSCPNIKDYKDPNPPKKRVVMLPMIGKPFCVIICVLAPKVLEETAAILIHECFLYCWPTLSKSIALEYECTLKQKCQQLLRVARRLFTQVASLETLMQMAMDQAKQLTKAQYCSVMLVDVERMELIEMSYQGKTKKKLERRFPIGIGITGSVIKTGYLVNAKAAKEHPDYDATIDCQPGIECNSMLCFPIREQSGIIGVGQLINKVGDPYFDAMDEEMALSFSVYCGVCIVHSVVYQKIEEAHIRNTLANELVMYHMKVGDAEVSHVLECTGFHDYPHFTSLYFNTRLLPLRELPCYTVRMFADLGFERTETKQWIDVIFAEMEGPRDYWPGHFLYEKNIFLRENSSSIVNVTNFNIKRSKMVRFILHVQKGYRDVPYHNWHHGFNTAQWAYSVMLSTKLVKEGYFSELQALMYFISSLVHDLDHRGTTNSFQIQGQTTLAALYSSEGSVMERHHLAQAICMLNTEGCDILEALPRRDYDRALILMRDIILASDLANYFKNVEDYKLIANDFQKGNRVHSTALQAMLMNAADLSDQLKDWNCIKKTAAAVLTEFFRQGDAEKSRGDLPAIIMDRDKCFIPELEIQFVSTICIPLYELLAKILPKTEGCVKVLENHLVRWNAAKPIFAEVPISGGLAVLLSPELEVLIENNIKEMERQRQMEAEAMEEEQEGRSEKT